MCFCVAITQQLAYKTNRYLAVSLQSYFRNHDEFQKLHSNRKFLQRHYFVLHLTGTNSVNMLLSHSCFSVRNDFILLQKQLNQRKKTTHSNTKKTLGKKVMHAKQQNTLSHITVCSKDNRPSQVFCDTILLQPHICSWKLIKASDSFLHETPFNFSADSLRWH